MKPVDTYLSESFSKFKFFNSILIQNDRVVMGGVGSNDTILTISTSPARFLMMIPDDSREDKEKEDEEETSS